MALKVNYKIKYEPEQLKIVIECKDYLDYLKGVQFAHEIKRECLREVET